MKTAVIYASQTGNTERLAQAIASALPSDTPCQPVQPNMKIDASLIFVGFWTDKGTCPLNCAEFLASLEKKKIVLFGTCGMQQSKEYYDGIIKRVSRFIPPGNTVVGSFMCQGEMPAAVKERYLAALEKDPNDARMQQMLNVYEEGIGHPNKQDLVDAAQFARELYQKLS